MPKLARPIRSIPARNALVEQWQGLPLHVARRTMAGRGGPLPDHLSLDDLVSIGQLALIRAAELWVPGRGSAFSSYAFRAILFRLLRALEVADRSANHQRRFRDDDDFPAAEQDDHRHEELQIVLSRLPRRERKFLHARFVRGGIYALAKKMGVSHQCVSERSRAALRRAREIAAELR